MAWAGIAPDDLLTGVGSQGRWTPFPGPGRLGAAGTRAQALGGFSGTGRLFYTAPWALPAKAER